MEKSGRYLMDLYGISDCTTSTLESPTDSKKAFAPAWDSLDAAGPTITRRSSPTERMDGEKGSSTYETSSPFLKRVLWIGEDRIEVGSPVSSVRTSTSSRYARCLN